MVVGFTFRLCFMVGFVGLRVNVVIYVFSLSWVFGWLLSFVF